MSTIYLVQIITIDPPRVFQDCLCIVSQANQNQFFLKTRRIWKFAGRRRPTGIYWKDDGIPLPGILIIISF